MKGLLIGLSFILCSNFANAQESNGFWQLAPQGFELTNGKPVIHPDQFASFLTSETTIKNFLSNLSSDPEQALRISLPTPIGTYRIFKIWATSMMEKPLALEYPQITTYTAEAADNAQVTAQIDYTPFGFHAMVFDGANTYLIDPYTGNAENAYIAYYKRDYIRPVSQRMSCELSSEDAALAGQLNLTHTGVPGLQNLVYGTTKRTYRLALAADSEYCIAVAGVSPTKAAVLAKMVTTINRVNGVYQRELAVNMVLIAKEDTLIFNTTATDPYTDNSGSKMLTQNQATVVARIGMANFDIGHVFSTGGGGIATLGSVCNSSVKAEGVTGSASPIGDAFDIDYVSHEMGHQFGADHTFNANTGSCLNNGNQSTAYEPGSGTTIMAYSGICGSPNDFQAHSDAYFHSTSLEAITTYITSGSGATCPTTATSVNLNASVPAYAASYAIPYKTPFELMTPTATDATADTLTYCWEERDLGAFKNTLAQTNINGPLFRSYSPSSSRLRVFPEISKIINNLIPLTKGEKLPDTPRTLSFQFTERDIYHGFGTFNFPTDAISLNVIKTSAPFLVTAPSLGDTWVGGQTATVTWDVVGTTAAPISASKVDIYLSVDGGYTYPTLVLSGTPNDGSQVITVPNVATTNSARIKVKGNGNIFFNISNGDFTINHSTVGIHTTSLLDNFMISPNPATNFLTLSAPANLGKVTVRIMNALGQIVSETECNGTLNITTSNWARGIYSVQLFNANSNSVSRKIVLQ